MCESDGHTAADDNTKPEMTMLTYKGKYLYR